MYRGVKDLSELNKEKKAKREATANTLAGTKTTTARALKKTATKIAAPVKTSTSTKKTGSASNKTAIASRVGSAPNSATEKLKKARKAMNLDR